MIRSLWLPVVLLVLSPAQADAQEPSTQTVSPLRAELSDGRHLAFYCAGAGSPTVIFDAGLGGDARVWSRVQPEIAKTTRACAFDRPGYGASDEGPAPRDAAHIVSDLREGLEAAGIAGPYVLVGHSMAGYDMRLFANLYAADVDGMVLVDPSIDGNEAPLRAVSPAFGQGMDDFHATVGRCIRAAADGQMTPGNPVHAECGSPPPDSPMANAALARTTLSEQQSMDESSRQVLASEPASSTLPLIVLTAGGQEGSEARIPASERIALTAVTRRNHADIAARSSAGIHRVVEGAPHNIQWAQPDAVVAAILEVIGKVDTVDR